MISRSSIEIKENFKYHEIEINVYKGKSNDDRKN